jgi:hypothetical protein
VCTTNPNIVITLALASNYCCYYYYYQSNIRLICYITIYPATLFVWSYRGKPWKILVIRPWLKSEFSKLQASMLAASCKFAQLDEILYTDLQKMLYSLQVVPWFPGIIQMRTCHYLSTLCQADLFISNNSKIKIIREVNHTVP